MSILEKRKVLIGLSVILLLGTAAVAQTAKDNIILNGGFEKMGTGWGLGKAWTLSKESPYKGKICACLNYTPAKQWKFLIQPAKVSPKSYYRASFFYRSTIPYTVKLNNGINFYVDNGKKVLSSGGNFHPYPEWTEGVYYFYSGDNTTVRLCCYLQGSSSGKVWVDEVRLVKLKNLDLKEKFIPNADFEVGEVGSLPPGWYDRDAWMKEKKPASSISFDSNANFIKGKKSLKLDASSCSVNVKASVQSSYLPIVPGKSYVLSLWLKGKKSDTSVGLWVEAYFPPAPHWYKQRTIKVDTSWRRYTLKFFVPTELKQPALKKRLVDIAIHSHDIVWVDDIELKMEEQ